LTANIPVEVALKYDGGKQVQSRIPEAPDQMMYTVCGDDTIYLPLSVAAQITALGIRKMELISIMKRAALIAAFDATQECERYAHTKGVELEFGTEDVRAISNTIFIQLSKDPGFGALPQKVNGGAQPWQQQ
jgi:hypothetical protein